MTPKDKKEQDNQDNSYTAESIKVLKGLEAVRRRPAMFIGSTGSRGLHHLVYEVVDNSIDEALAGFCKNITVIINKDNTITVKDDGRGIPVEEHPTEKKSALEVALTILHAGGKFDSKSYKVSGGLHGVGVSVVNALSEWMVAEVGVGGYLYRQRYQRGVPDAPVEKVGKIPTTGTVISFKPDKDIFDAVVFERELLSSRFQELAFLTPEVTITFLDERPKNNKTIKEVYHYEGGVDAFVRQLNKNKDLLHLKPITFHAAGENIHIDVSLEYTTGYSENIYSFANNINTSEGGTHLTGFKTALTKAVIDYGDKNNLLKSDSNLTGEDVREGLTAVISVRLLNPQFEGQTKTKLGNSEIQGLVYSLVYEKLRQFFEDTPQVSKKIVAKVLTAAHSRAAARKARELTRRKSTLESGSLPGKLADCSSEDMEIAEIFLVEGDSAGGSAKQGRDRRFQAILPLRGKILNVEKARLDKLLHNEEIGTIITALGSGLGDEFDLAKLRYGKLIIMTDADIDGAHIRTLLLTFFFRYMKDLINAGRVYIATPPLYRIKYDSHEQYVFNASELEKVLKELEPGAKYTLQRYKGLGEMNPEQLWATTMDPERRTLQQISINNAAAAENIFTVLMGDNVESRRKFIEKHATEVRNLDV